MKDIIMLAALLAVLAMMGCGGMTPGPDKDFWDQCIKFDGYGFSMLTQYGPFNLGKVTWERNVACEKDIKQQTPIASPIR